MHSDHRQSPRKLLIRPAQVRLTNGQTFLAKTMDVGLNGVGLMMPEALNVGVQCLVSFDLLMAGRHYMVGATGKVCYSTCSGLHGFKTGLHFTQIDEKSAAHIAMFMGPMMLRPAQTNQTI